MSDAATVRISARRAVLARGLALVAVAVSLLFLYTGVEKWSDIAAFERVVVSHGLLETTTARPASVALAVAEIAVGVLGLALVMLRGPTALALVLMLQSALFVGFAVYAALLVAKPPPEPTSCGCGILSAATAHWPQILTRSAIADAALAGASLLALRGPTAGPEPL